MFQVDKRDDYYLDEYEVELSELSQRRFQSFNVYLAALIINNNKCGAWPRGLFLAAY